jgi:ABC-type sugar transport system permease subunit
MRKVFINIIKKNKIIQLLPFLLPPLLIYVAIEGSAVIGMFNISFQEWKNGLFNYVGLLWYKNIFQDRYLWIATYNTIRWLAISETWAVIFPFGIALLLSQKLKGDIFFKGVLIIPQSIGFTAAGLMWSTIYSPDAGILNIFLRILGLERLTRSWLGDPNFAIYCLIFAQIWMRTGFYMMIYLVGLQSLSKEVLDASMVDGVNFWQRLIYIIVPLMRRSFIVVVSLDLISVLTTFDIVATTTRGGPGVSTEVLGTRIYKAAFEYWELGYSAALATALFVLSMIITIIYLNIVVKDQEL